MTFQEMHQFIVDSSVSVIFLNMLSRDKIICTINNKFNRKLFDLEPNVTKSYSNNATSGENTGPSDYNNLNHMIDEVWILRTSLNKSLFNATKFRLDSCTGTKKGTVNFNIGITDYRDFIGTNDNPVYINALTHLDNRQDYMSNTLGVGAVVLTSDEYVILIKRSRCCAEEPEQWDRPGGHPEPERLFGTLPSSEIDLSTTDWTSVRDEIVESVSSEVRDEVNIPGQLCQDPLLMGVSLNKKTCDKPSLEFFISCELTREQVEERYRRGSQLEAAETTDIRFLCKDDVSEVVRNRDNALWTRLAPCAKAALYIYANTIEKLHPHSAHDDV